jgi:hypothetical protein
MLYFLLIFLLLAGVTLYPNPATGTTEVVCAEWPKGVTSATLRLYDRFGEAVRTMVLQQAGPESTSLNLRGLRPGIYRYVVQLGDKASQGTLLVQP